MFGLTTWLHPNAETGTYHVKVGAGGSHDRRIWCVPIVRRLPLTVQPVRLSCRELNTGAPYGSRTRLFKLKTRTQSPRIKADSDNSRSVHGTMNQWLWS